MLKIFGSKVDFNRQKLRKSIVTHTTSPTSIVFCTLVLIAQLGGNCGRVMALLLVPFRLILNYCRAIEQ
jgi:hypothetical protein